MRDPEWPPLRAGHAQRKNYLQNQQTPAGCGLPEFAFFTDGVVPESSIWRSGSTGQDGVVKLFPAGNAASPGPGLPCEKRFRKNPQIFPEPDSYRKPQAMLVEEKSRSVETVEKEPPFAIIRSG